MESKTMAAHHGLLKWRLECWVNPSPPSAAYMRQWIRSALVQVMACRLFGAKPLSKPMLGYCQLHPYKQTSVNIVTKYKTFYSSKYIWNIICEMAAIFTLWNNSGWAVTQLQAGNLTSWPFLRHMGCDKTSQVCHTRSTCGMSITVCRQIATEQGMAISHIAT